MNAQPTLFDQPRSRHSDPSTSKVAAGKVAPAVPELNEAILYAARALGPSTAFRIAAYVETMYPGRWDEGTCRTRVSALGKARKLAKADEAGRSPRGQRCTRWHVPARLVRVDVVTTNGRL